jgi:ATP-dependent DNA helicase RecQ
VDSQSRFSKEVIILTLFGSKSQKIIQNCLNELGTYGSFLSEDIDEQEAMCLIDYLLKEKYIFENRISQSTFLTLNQLGMELFLNQELLFPQLDLISEARPRGSILHLRLRHLRKMIASELGVSPFLIFDNKVLEVLVDSQPTSRSEFLEIKGLGEKKWDQFGEAVIKILANKEEKLGNDLVQRQYIT